MTIAATAELGCAIRITTVGPTVQVFRIADASTIDNGAGEQYDPDLIAADHSGDTIADPTSPIADAGSLTVTIANRAGQLWSALNSGVVMGGALVEAWLTVNQEFDSTDEPIWAGTIAEDWSSIDDESGKFVADGPMGMLDGLKLPYRTINADDNPNAPSPSIGKVRPMRWGSWGGGGRRDAQAYVIDRATMEVCVLETLCPDGSHVVPAAVIDIPNHGGHSYPGLDSGHYVVASGEVDLTKLQQMASHMNQARRTIAYDNTVSRNEANGTYRIGGTSTGLVTVRIADPPEDTPDPVTPDPCATVTVTEDPEDPTIQEQCPTTPPRVPHDSWGGRRLGHFPGDADTGEPDFDPETDLIFGARASYVGKNPSGVGYHNNHSDFGGILYDMIARFLGFGDDAMDQPTFFSAEDWPGGPGTQTELTAKNSPRLEVQYDAREVIASGLWENGAALVVRAGKMSLVKLDPMGSPSGVAYAITPSVVSDGGFSFAPGRWGRFANDVYMTAFGHPLDPTQFAKASAHRQNADSIAERIAAKLPPLVTYTVGEEYGRAYTLWLDGADDARFKARCEEILGLLSSRQALYDVTIVPPTEDTAAVLAIPLGGHVSLVWPNEDDSLGEPRGAAPAIPEDEPAVCLVIGRKVDLLNHTVQLRLLRFIGTADGESGCIYLRVAPESPTFPAELCGGDATTWDDGLTDAQKDWWMCNLGGTDLSCTAPV